MFAIHVWWTHYRDADNWWIHVKFYEQYRWTAVCRWKKLYRSIAKAHTHSNKQYIFTIALRLASHLLALNYSIRHHLMKVRRSAFDVCNYSSFFQSRRSATILCILTRIRTINPKLNVATYINWICFPVVHKIHPHHTSAFLTPKHRLIWTYVPHATHIIISSFRDRQKYPLHFLRVCHVST